MYRDVRLTLVAAFFVLSATPTVAREYLPPNVTVIDRPFSHTEFIIDAARTDTHLLMSGSSSGPACTFGSGHCPALYFYERQNSRWVLHQTIDFSESGLAYVHQVGQDRFVVERSYAINASTHNHEMLEYQLNPASNSWEATVVAPGGDPTALAYYNGSYLLACGGVNCGRVTFVDNVGGNWEATDVLYLSTVRDLGEGYIIYGMVVHNDAAYIMFCGHDDCINTRGVALIDMNTRTFVDYFDVQAPGLVNFVVFDDQVITSSHDGAIPIEFHAPQVYEKISGAWQYTGEALPSFEWNSKDNKVAQTDSLFFETRTARLDLEDADGLTYFERNIAGQWEQIGSVMIPNGDRIMNSMTLLMVYDNKVYFADSPSGAGLRILEIDDYFDYLDRDKDIMPKWWEELYGFSPDAFDDFLGDTDQDGLTDTREYGLQTSPIDSDTDGDQMRDDWELRFFFDPRDPTDGDEDLDLDGVSNRNEYLNGTNPMIADGPIVNEPPTSSGGGGGTGIIWLCLLFIFKATALLSHLRRDRGRNEVSWSYAP